MSLPKYYFLSEETLRERDQDPKKFERKVAEIERSILEWDTDGGYAKLIQEAREESAVVSGDETTAEHIFTEKVSHMAAERYLESEREREEKEEAEERERKLAEKLWKEAEEAELRRRMRKQGKELATPVAGERKRKNSPVGTNKKIEEVEERERKLAEEAELRRRRRMKGKEPALAAAAGGSRASMEEKEWKEAEEAELRRRQRKQRKEAAAAAAGGSRASTEEKEWKEAEEAELRRRRRKKGKEPAAAWGSRASTEEREWKEAEEAELRRRRRKKGKEPAPARKQGKEEEAAPARKRKRNKIDFAAIGLDPPPRGLADVIKERNEGVSDVKLVIMKELFKTDLTTNHGRLSMPEQQVIDGNFVTAEEDALISGPSPTGIRVQLIGPTEDETTEMMLKRWTINRSSSYVLNHNWNPLVLKFENVLKVGAIVQVWSFRTADGELRFQIHIIRHAPDESESGSEDPPVGFASGSGRDNNNHEGDGSGGSDGSVRPSTSATEDNDDLPPPPIRRSLASAGGVKHE